MFVFLFSRLTIRRELVASIYHDDEESHGDYEQDDDDDDEKRATCLVSSPVSSRGHPSSRGVWTTMRAS